MIPSYATKLVVLALAVDVFICSGQVIAVNGASFDSTGPMAPGSFATMFGQNLCGQTAAGLLSSSGTYPMALGNCSITVNGAIAMMQYASPGQVNFLIPLNTATGAANVVIHNGAQALSGSMMIGPAGPGVFSLDGTGVGNGAMLHATTWQMGPFSVTTNGQPTPVAIFMTGMDLSVQPMVTVGGVPVMTTFYGMAPGYPGLQQINIALPANMAGVGRVPVTVSSNGQISNLTLMSILPTTAMMRGMPGWGSEMTIGENSPRAAEMVSIAVNPSNNTVLVTDEAGDALRIISLDSKVTIATIALPSGSQAGAVAVDSSGKLAAVALTEKGSIAFIDLTGNQVSSVIGTGYYACRLAFAGTNLLVTNEASGTLSVIDTGTRQVVRTVKLGYGPSGIGVFRNSAVIANMQGGSVSVVNLADFSVTNVSLPAGSRPSEVAISSASGKALITNPMGNDAFLLSLDTMQMQHVDLAPSSGIGPGGVAANGSLAFIANQMAATVTVMDLNTGVVLKTFPVDPGPRSIAVNPAKNQLLVLCQGTGTLDLVDLTSYLTSDRINATSGTVKDGWALPSITSIDPSTAKIGSSFTMTITGSNLQSVTDVTFRFAFSGADDGTMGGGMGMGDDSNIKVTGVKANADGTQITASVQVLTSAVAGTRQLRLDTNHGEMMGPLNSKLLTVTQ